MNALVKTIEENKLSGKKIKSVLDTSRTILEQAYHAPMHPKEREKVEQFSSRYAVCWFMRELAQKYTLLSPEILELTQTIKSDGGYDMKIPVLWNAQTKYVKPSTAVTYKTTEERRQYQYEIKVYPPELTIEARQAEAEALVYSCELVKKAMQDSLLKEILDKDSLQTKRTIKLPYEAEFKLVWAPEKFELKKIIPPPTDPAIFMDYQEQLFLIHQWDIPEERSLEAILRNYSLDVEDLPKISDEGDEK